MLAASKKKIILTLVIIILSPISQAESTVIRGRYFYENTLPIHANFVSAEWVTKIENHLQQVDTNTTAEIVVYVVQSLSGHGIRDRDGTEITEIVKLGVYIFNDLPLDTPNGPVVGIGKKGKDNGVLVLVAMQERQWRIEVGYGLEGDITDIQSNRIAQQYLIPKFTEGKYGEGLYDTVVALSQEIPASLDSSVSGELPLWVVVVIVTAIAVVLIILAYLVKKGKIKLDKMISKGWSRGGGGSTGGRGPSGGQKGGGGRSGGGGAGGKW